MLAVGRLRRADEPEPRVVERHAVLRVPAAQDGARDLARHRADGGGWIDPARRHEIDPGLAVALAHELDRDAADAVGEIVIGGAGDGVGHALEPELLEARQEFLVVLVAEDAEHPLCRIGGRAARDQRQDQAGEIGVIEPRGGRQAITFQAGICLAGARGCHCDASFRTWRDARGPAASGHRGRS